MGVGTVVGATQSLVLGLLTHIYSCSSRSFPKCQLGTFYASHALYTMNLPAARGAAAESRDLPYILEVETILAHRDGTRVGRAEGVCIQCSKTL